LHKNKQSVFGKDNKIFYSILRKYHKSPKNN